MRAEDSPVPRGDSSDEEQEEALLAALAQQAAAFGTPLSLAASQQGARAFGSQLQGASQGWQAGSSQMVGSPSATQEVGVLLLDALVPAEGIPQMRWATLGAKHC